MDHAAARLRARLEAAENAAAEANQRDAAEVRRRYCDTAELQWEKGRLHTEILHITLARRARMGQICAHTAQYGPRPQSCT